MEPRGQCQHERDLHQFAWLYLQAAQLQPALRAFAHMAHPQHGREQRDRNRVKRPGQPRDQADIHQGDADHQHDADCEPNQVAAGERLSRTPGRRIQRDITDARQRAEQQDIEPADLQQLVRDSERWFGPKQTAVGQHASGSVIRALDRVNKRRMNAAATSNFLVVAQNALDGGGTRDPNDRGS